MEKELTGVAFVPPQPEAATQAVATTVRRSVNRLGRRLRAERADHGISSSKLNVLGHLMRAGPMTATDLASLEHVQPQSLTRTLLRLEEFGLIAREQAEADRRQVRIEITQTGRALLREDSQRQDAWLSRAMAETLTEAERDILAIAARLLHRLSDAPVLRTN
jgi:DNA-binding MarR family transcriptional regulator